MYAFQDSTQVSGELVNVAGMNLTPQQITAAIGRLFAFLIKASLVLATTVAYIQLFFRLIWSCESKLSTLDELFSDLFDITALSRPLGFAHHAISSHGGMETNSTHSFFNAH